MDDENINEENINEKKLQPVENKSFLQQLKDEIRYKYNSFMIFLAHQNDAPNLNKISFNFIKEMIANTIREAKIAVKEIFEEVSKPIFEENKVEISNMKNPEGNELQASNMINLEKDELQQNKLIAEITGCETKKIYENKLEKSSQEWENNKVEKKRVAEKDINNEKDLSM